MKKKNKINKQNQIRPAQHNLLQSNTYFWIAAFFVALVTFLVYLPALRNNFVNWDDHIYVYENQNIRSLNLGFLKWCLTAEVPPLWHPLALISLAVDYAIWGLNPWGYHLANVTLHSFNTLLVFILAAKLIEYGMVKQDNKKVLTIASVTSLLFGIHPIHVESVAWISERKDVLYSFFFLSSLLTYIRYVSATNPTKYRFYALSLISFIFALMSKPMAVTLPMVLLLLDYFPFKRLTVEKGFRNSKSVIYEKLPFFMLSVLTAFITIWLHWSVGGLMSIEKLPFITRIISAMHAYIFYLIKMIAPLDLAPLYPYPHTIDFFTLEYFGSLTLLLIITFIALRCAKKNNLFTAIWLYYLLTLIPVIGIVQVGRQAVADRYTYLPSLGPFLLAGLGIGYLSQRCLKRRYRITLITALFLISTILSSKTIKQIGIWQNSITLWSYEIKLFPDVSLAYYSRGLAYYKLNNYQKALEDLNKTIEIDPQYMNVYYDRGVVYQDVGNYREAMNNYSKAIEINPQFDKAYNNRGNVSLQLGDYPHAIEDFNQAIKLNADIPDYYYNRGVALHNLGNYEQALKDYSRTVKLDPRYTKAYSNRANVFKRLGNHPQAIIDYSIAIELDPQSSVIYYNRGIAYHESGNYQQAINDYSKAIDHNSQYADAYFNRGVAYKDIENYDQAIKDFNKAIELAPQDATAYYNMGLCYIQLGNIRQSISYYKKAADLGSKEAQAYLRKKGRL